MMKSLKTSDKLTIDPKSSANLLIITMLDTVMRTFVPTIGGVIIGVWADNFFSLAPFYTISCIIVGTLISAGLITIQLRDVKKIC